MTLMHLFEAGPDLEVQIILVLASGLFWFVAIKLLTEYVMKPYVSSRPWCSKWTVLNQNTFRKTLMAEFDLDEAFPFSCDFLSICVQHGIGGALCVASSFGIPFIPSHVAYAMARHGALCEAGWELQDALSRLLSFVFAKDGRKKNPPKFLVVVLLHHVMGLSMVIPMNLRYGDNTWYHELVFLLQFAAVSAMGFQQYGFTLDVKTQGGLRQMKLCVFLTWLIILYSRVLRFVYVAFQLVLLLHQDGSMNMFYAGLVAISAMSVINVSFFLDCTSKVMKFAKMKHKDEAIEEEIADATSMIEPCPVSPVSTKSDRSPATDFGMKRRDKS